MKLLCLILALPLLACGSHSALMPEARAAAEPQAALADSADILAVRAVRVQQYEDRMPVDHSTPPGPRMITLIQFEADVCEPMTDGDFQAAVGARADQVVISPRQVMKSCETPHAQTFTVSSNAFAASSRLTVANPVAIEVLPPSE